MAIVCEMFPPEALALQQEIATHPLLVKNLSVLGAESTMEERFAVCAAYCGMVVDGYYNDDAVRKLCVIMLHKLQDMGKLVVN